MVTVGGLIVNCVAWTSTVVQCISPASQGRNVQVQVSVGRQFNMPVPSALVSTVSITYSPPVLDASSSGPWFGNTSGLTYFFPNGSSEDGPVLQPQTLILEGENFGTQGTVKFGPLDIPSNSSSVLLWEHSRIVMYVPQYAGRGHRVTVAAGSGLQTQIANCECAHCAVGFCAKTSCRWLVM